MAYSAGLSAFMLIKVLAPGYFARQDMKTPVRIGIIAMVANMILNPLFIYPLYTIYDLGHVGLALATSASAWLNAGLLYRGLKQKAVLQNDGLWRVFSLRLGVSVAVMSGVLWALQPDSTWWESALLWDRVFGLGGLVAAGGVSYLLSLWLMGVRWSDLREPRTS